MRQINRKKPWHIPGYVYDMANGDYVYELGVDPWVPGMLAYVRKGIKEATVFQELCNQHDHKLFETIDRAEIELDYKNLLLMSYRALLRERFKKTVKLESYGVFSQEFIDVNNGMVSETFESIIYSNSILKASNGTKKH